MNPETLVASNYVSNPCHVNEGGDIFLSFTCIAVFRKTARVIGVNRKCKHVSNTLVQDSIVTAGLTQSDMLTPLVPQFVYVNLPQLLSLED